MEIRKLILKDVRCFAGVQEFDIRRMTFLVGENSSGKSTALGCARVISDVFSRGADRLDFNVDPHQMGAFSDIVRRGRPKINEFQIGLAIRSRSNKIDNYIVTFNEKEKGSEPAVHSIEFFRENFSYKFIGRHFRGENVDTLENFNVKRIRQTDSRKNFVVEISSELIDFTFDSIIFRLMSSKQGLERPASSSSLNQQFLEHCGQTFGHKHIFSRKLNSKVEMLSFAPIRSSPQRTYNALKEEISPDGFEIPNLLMNLSRADPKRWLEIQNRVLQFGEASGLFKNVTVRHLGKSVGDPFQLQIQVRGPKVNLIDVGYGVNQILPILVRIFHSNRTKTFLMQQPEVHLHPKAQAELTSLLCQLATKERKTFVVETHSDYMIDRARIEIMKGNINPEDVSLIYLEPVSNGSKVQVHNITLDKQANLVGVPKGYRSFFLDETSSLLGLE